MKAEVLVGGNEKSHVPTNDEQKNMNVLRNYIFLKISTNETEFVMYCLNELYGITHE